MPQKSSPTYDESGPELKYPKKVAADLSKPFNTSLFASGAKGEINLCSFSAPPIFSPTLSWISNTKDF